MPDGDNVRSVLPPPFRSPFTSLCQGVDVEELEKEFSNARLMLLKRLGNEPVKVLMDEAQVLERIQASGLFLSATDYRVVDTALDRIRQTAGNPAAVAAALKAFQVIAHRVLSGETSLTGEIRVALLTEYAQSAYDLQCHNRIPMAIQEYPKANVEQVRNSASILRNLLAKDAESVGKQLARNEKVDKLRKARRPPNEGNITASYEL